MLIQFAWMSVDDCIGLLRGQQGIVHTVLIISLLFLQERFLVRSDNLDELAKLSVIVSLIFWAMLPITHTTRLENSIGCVTDRAPFL